MRKTVKVLLAVTLAVLMVCTLVACGETDTQQTGNDVKYTISFETNGGSAVANLVVDGKSEITIPQTTKEGYFFAGWYVDNGTFNVRFNLAYITANSTKTAITVYAKWSVEEVVEQTYTVAFDSNGGSAVGNIVIAAGNTIKLPADPTKTEYSFVGWFVDNNTFQIPFDLDYIKANPTLTSITLYAKWIKETSAEFFDFAYTDSTSTAYSIKKKADITLPNEVVLPSSYNGKPVTIIGKDAFLDCRELTSITIGSGVTSIGWQAFSGCSGLTSITVYTGNAKYHSSGNCLIETATNTLIAGCKSSVVPIDGSVKRIRDKAFKDCSCLTSITIPVSVENIELMAFEGCTYLKKINCEAASKPSGWSNGWSCYATVVWGYNNIATDDNYDYVLHGDEAYLTKYKGTETVVTLPSTIGGYAVIGFGAMFSGNKKNISVIIPSSVTRIGEDAFYGCKGLISVTIGSGVTSMGDGAFAGCSKLTSITIPNNVTSIEDNAFAGCSGLTSITIGSGVTSIEERTFDRCSGLTSITIPNSVTSIGEMAFDDCSGLTSITIPNSVTSIGYCAFLNCSGLTSITIGSGVTSIGDDAFYHCNTLASITVDKGNTKYHSADNCLIDTTNKVLILGCKTSVIPTDGSVTSIGQSAFRRCSGLTSITIPDCVTSIGEYAFNGTAWLNNQPDGLVYAGKVAYVYKGTMPQDTAITLRDDTKGIADGAFFYCSGLTSITIPDSVTTIGSGVFGYCTELTAVTIGSGVTSIGYYAFNNCRRLTSITIPNSVTSIGERAFYDCIWLHRVTIGSGVTSIGDLAFSGCSLLNFVTIPDSVTSIGKSAFSRCSGLTSITIPDSVTTIEWYAFSGCTKLTTINCEAASKPSGWSDNWKYNCDAKVVWGYTGE